MKPLFIIIVLLHGALHLLGFAKGFGLARVDALATDISKPSAVLWFIACLLFFAGMLFFSIGRDWWWAVIATAILLSQVLIILHWKDAKAGTIANIIICLVAIAGYGEWSFNRQVRKEITGILSKARSNTQQEIVTKQMTAHLPYPVRNWLMRSGTVGKPKTRMVRLEQQGYMKTTRESKPMPVKAEQYFTIDTPAFIWKVKAKMNALMYITGRDRFETGKGNMLIKAYGLFPIVDGRGDKIDQGSMLRYLSEMCWFPSAALSPYIKWEEIDNTAAKATMTYNGLTVSAVFEFDENGRPARLTAKRYMGTGPAATLEDWTIPLTEWKVMDGINIPVKGVVTWKLKDGDFDYYQWEITAIDYE